MQTVLGLSMTSTSVGWVLLDGDGPDAAALDHDAFDVDAGTPDISGETAQHKAAVRGAQSIATTSGHKVSSVRVTWTEDIDADAKNFVKSLADLGFDNVLAMPLSKAGQAWGLEAGRESEHTKSGICILEPGAATIMIVAAGAGSVRTAVTENRSSADDLIDWLRTVFREDGWLPECLYLVGSRRDLDEVAEPIADALPIPVLDTVDAQLALARGAALASATQLDTETSPVVEAKRDPARPVLPAAETADSATTEAVQTVVRPIEPSAKAAKPRERPWLLAHAKKVTISAAGVAVVGAALSLAAGSSFNGDNVLAQATDPALPDTSLTSATPATVHAAAAPLPAVPPPAAQPLAAAPTPAAVPPEASPPAAMPPPETVTRAAEPVIAATPQPVAVPAPQHTTASSQHTTAPTSTAAPVGAAAPVTPTTAVPVGAPAPVTPPPAAPLAAPAPAAPPAAGAPIVPAPSGAPPAPGTAPPAPGAAPPAPADSPDAPPPDPIQTLMSTLFGSLP